MGSPPVAILLLLLVIFVVGEVEGGQWCIARSLASDAALQSALDYVCGTGMADCLPIQPSGLCYLPNTMQAHASYAFNSYYQRSRGAPGACDFAGTAAVTITDPSYGSCTFPSSASTAGGNTTPTTPNTNTPTTTPVTNMPPAPGFVPTVPNTDISAAASAILLPLLLFTCCYFLPLLF